MKKFDINKFCKTDLHHLNPKIDITTPWQKDDKVYATNGEILFIGESTDFPEIPLSDSEKLNIKSLNIDKISQYTPITIAEIKEILISHPPEIDIIYEVKQCSECQGRGYIEKKCSECQNSYIKTCRQCQGSGTLKTSNIIGREIMPSKTPFKNTLIDWKYLEIIKDSMQTLGGEWQVSLREPLESVVFKNDTATIVVAPMK